MKQPLPSRFLRAALSLLLIASWLGAANHCLLAGFVKAPAAATPDHCAMQESSAPKKHDNGCDGQNCCKSLSVVASALAKNLVAYDIFSFATQDYLISTASLLEAAHAVPTGQLDTGPPPGHSFAESILQQSLLAHAPPSLA
ncbi:MAG: hypothetical protein ACR2NX_03155 [Chthoniobacterales bacterium]